jgi:hypothetical protein
MINLFDNNNEDFAFLLDQMGSDILLNDNTIRALITNTNLEQNYDDRRISSLSPLNRGDIVLFEGKKYIIISEVNAKRYSKFKANMRHLPHSITINSQCRFYTLDCYINTSNLGVIDGRVLSIPDGEITVISTLINNDSDLRIDARFLLYGEVFKVTGIDRGYSKPGMIILTCKKDLIDTVTDDLINGIAGGLACPVDITSSDFSIAVDSTHQLTWSSAEDAPVKFTSSDETVATVDANGLVTGLAEGVATITIANDTNERIQDTVSVAVIDVPAGYTINLISTGDLEQINKGYTRTYNVEVTQHGTVVNEPVQWELFADDQTTSTTLAEIQSQTYTSCVVKGVALGYVQLKVSLASDTAVNIWQRVRVKSVL